ncbi:DUF429 domain-containing protein [Halarchaeum sp. P4]|uniref:DUF429 domain-containing protein n=1 Tax=Halarchaeum sp. P4 TaxID=3421639 RepID=UPI003EBBD89B
MGSEMGYDIYGIDFSGAERAGEKVWVASARDEGDALVVDRVEPASERFGVTERAAVHEALVDFLAGSDAAAVGLDFPFGLPADFVEADDWTDFCARFGERFADPEDFRESCLEAADGTHERRETDERVDALSPYHFVVQNQTFYGIRDVLAPLRERGVPVEPMAGVDADGASETGPHVCETYPAGVLDHYALFREGYTGDDRSAANKRARNFDGIERCTAIEYEDRDALRETVKQDEEGDALDAVLCAIAAAHAREDGYDPGADYDPIEGHIYV